MRFDDVDTDGHAIRLVRCPRCAQIVARVYGDVEIRYRVLDPQSRDRTFQGGRFPVSGPSIFLGSTDLDDLMAGGDVSARCTRCKIGYDVRDVADTARHLIRTDRRSSKLRPRRATL